MSFSSSSSSYHDELHTPLQSPPPLNRKIRFAPLPDPRRSVLITDDGEELFLPDDLQKPASYPDILPKPTFPLDDSSASASSLSSPPSESDYASPSPPLCPSPVPPQPAPTPQPRQASPPPMKRTLPPAKSRLPFFRLNKKSSPDSSSSSSSSSHTLTPTTSIDNGSATPTNAARRPSSSHSPFSRFNFSTEEILTLGTINLFRTSSRNSECSGHQSDSGVGGWGLNRWTSASSFGKPKSYGSPLARTQSAEPSSVKTPTQLSKSTSLPASVFPSTKAAPAPKKPTPLPYGRKGTRLLNGRVYGAPKNRNNQNVNPFANARDDDEFVEWGYGGMGSVRGARSAGVIGNAGGTRWERLAQSGNVSVFGVDEKKGVGGVGENDDDGSGMSWVRKRRAAKEQAMREQEEREKAEATAKATANDSASTTTTEPIPPIVQTSSAGDSAASPPLATDSAAATDDAPSSTSDITPAVTNTATSPSTSANSSAPFPTLPSPPALARSPSTISSTKPSSSEMNMSLNPEHVLTAVTIPARMPRHRRVLSRTTSMTGSVNASGETVTSASTTSQAQDTLAVPGPSDKSSAAMPMPATPLEEKLEEQSESDSETESESDSGRRKNGANRDEEDDDDGEEDEDDEEAGVQEAKRRTALGAGVEKISRHN